jgi:flagellar biosynthesis component FlhA
MSESRVQQILLAVVCGVVAKVADNGFITIIMIAIAFYGQWETIKAEDREEEEREERKREKQANRTNNTQNKQ